MILKPGISSQQVKLCHCDRLIEKVYCVPVEFVQHAVV